MKDVELSTNITSIGGYAFYYCTSLSSIIIPNNVESIGEYAFADCISLNSVIIPNSVITIEKSSFSGCENLSSIMIPNSVTSIESDLFYKCTSLINITIPKSVTNIGIRAFAYCSGLRSVVIPETVTSIGASSFAECTGLTNITIPNSVTSINYNAFSGCSNLNDVYYNGTQEQWNAISIGSNNTHITNANIHYLVDDTTFISSATGSWNYTYGGEYHYWRVTPSQSATYVFESTLSSGDSYGYLYDSNFNEITKNDDGGDGSNFKISYNLTAGTTYYYGVRWYSSSTTGTIPVKLTKVAPDYTVTYNYSQNGGTSATQTSASAAEGSSANLSVTATKPGWDFVGWNTNPNATTALSSYTVTGNVTLYAIYKKTLSAKFYSCNNSLQQTKTVTIYNKETSGSLTAPSPSSYSGWTVSGWRDDTTAGTYEYSNTANITLSSDTSYYAVYSRTLTLSYNANGGNSTPSSSTATQYYNAYGNKQSKTFTLASAISRSGYNFDKWAKDSASGTKYSAGSSISISDNTTMYATWTEIQSVATPLISVSNITGGKQATISCSTSGATIYYTTDGSTPTTSSSVYSSPISFTTTGTKTIKALAVKSGYTNSSVASQSITVSQVSTPTASLSSGTITSATSVTLSCSTSNATIYYTTNGDTPTISSTRYSGAINISSTTTLKAIAVVSGYLNSSVATYNYTYQEPNIDENAPKITITDIKTMPGKEIQVTIDLSNNTGFASLGIEVRYNKDIMTLTNVTSNSGVGGTFTRAQYYTANPFNMAWDSASNITYNGNLATLTFTVGNDVPDGIYPITVDYYKGVNGNYVDGVNINYDEDFEAVGFVYVSGNVVIASYIPGDINGDENVDNKDATFLLRYLAGWSLSGIVEDALDIDGSTSVDNKDATILLRYLAGWNVVLH